jgi:hypothetical protein
MMIDVFDHLRNLYSASGGAVHPSAVSAALFGLMWNQAWKDGLAAGQSAYNAGASDAQIDQAFRDGFAESLGWSEAQAREFWDNTAYDFNPDDAQRFDEAWDTFDAFVEQMRKGGR